jgi:hypothetical protein
MGRRSTFDAKVATVICERLAEGQSLRQICKDKDMPGLGAVFSWLARHPDFASQYARAREEQADALADEITDIADADPQTVPIYDKDGKLVEIKIDTAFEAWRKTRIDARKWVASKLKPKKYGDKLEVDAKVSVGDAIVDRLTRASSRS